MGIFEQFPYANFHELNADWLMKELLTLKTSVEQFVAINALKYADPIQWNITSQYEKNTIVIDPLTGTAYISVQPVPSGVALTRTEYWTVVFDLGSFVVRAAKNFTDKFEEDTTLTATFPSAINDWLIWGDTLYRVISNIVAGDQYVVGSNIEHFTIETVIGHIQDLNTTDKSNLVAAINEVLTTLGNTTGDLNDLNTTDKSNLVAAINEVLSNLGDISQLITTDNSSAVGAINSLKQSADNWKVYNILDYITDPATDDIGAAINNIINLDSSPVKIYIPIGNYVCETGIIINKSNVAIIGESRGSVIKLTDYVTAAIDLSGNHNDCIIENIHINCDNKANYGIYSSDWCPELLLRNVKIGHAASGISVPTYLSVLEKCWCYSCTTGFDIRLYDGTRSTSTTLIDCYVTDATDGYDLRMTYSNLVGCAADRCDIAYNVLNSQGVNLLGCGSEYCKMAIKCTSWWGGSIIGYYGYNTGDDSYDDTHYVFDLSSAVDIVIAGYRGTIVGTPKLLNVSGTTNGYENVTVLDHSITKRRSSYTTSAFMFKRPIKFLRDSVGHDTEVSVATLDELKTAIANIPETIDYNLTIKLTADITLTTYTIELPHLIGEGRIIFNLNGHTLTSRSDTWKILRVLNCQPNITVRNGTLNNGHNSNQQQFIESINSRVSCEGVAFTNTLTKCGSGITALQGSFIVVGDNCTKSGSFGSDGVWNFMHCDNLSFMDIKATF